MFSEKNVVIYVLGDYAVHFMPDVRKTLYERGYILVLIGGGITGDVQINDTHMHRPLKRHYRDEEAELMLKKLPENSSKIPSPDRSEIINLTIGAWNNITVDCPRAFQQNFVTSTFDGSEDFLVSDTIFSLVGNDMIAFREKLLHEPVPSNLKALVKNLVPPKGIRRKNVGGSELLEYMDDKSEGGYGEETVSSSEDDSDNEEEAIVTASTLPAGPVAVNLPDTSQSSTPFFPLPGLCTDAAIDEDAQFLDALGNLFESHETSRLFLPHLTKLRSVYDDARRSVKRRIEENN